MQLIDEYLVTGNVKVDKCSHVHYRVIAMLHSHTSIRTPLAKCLSVIKCFFDGLELELG